jgi:hypothetical protein
MSNGFDEVGVYERKSEDPEGSIASVVLFDQGVGYMTRDEALRIARELLRICGEVSDG